MSIQVMVVVITGIFAALFVALKGMRHEERRMELKAGKSGDAGRLEALLMATQNEMAALRDRVQVLERLATDDDRKLADEINRLRDAGGADDHDARA
jgi:hypothetical protein